MHDPTRLPIWTLCQPTIRVSMVKKGLSLSTQLMKRFSYKWFFQWLRFWRSELRKTKMQRWLPSPKCKHDLVLIFNVFHCEGNVICRDSVIYLTNAVASPVGLERIALSAWRPSPVSTELVRSPLNATATKDFLEQIATAPYQLWVRKPPKLKFWVHFKRMIHHCKTLVCIA